VVFFGFPARKNSHVYRQDAVRADRGLHTLDELRTYRCALSRERAGTLAAMQQFRVMAFAQMTWRESLRDIEACLSAQSAKLYNMELRKAVARSTLADANESRDWRTWADFAQALIGKGGRHECVGCRTSRRGRRGCQRAAPLLLDEAVGRVEVPEMVLVEMLAKCSWGKRKRWCGCVDCHCVLARRALRHGPVPHRPAPTDDKINEAFERARAADD
jgi:hypothetical protein